MSQPTGKYHSVSYFRRLVIDLMHFSAEVPCITIDRRMNLARLIAARRACSPSPTWSAIFAKAFGKVAERTPALRTSYLKLPWPRFYEHASNIVTLNVDRQVEDERIVLYVHINNPEKQTLQELDEVIQTHRTGPLDQILSYKRALLMSRTPWPFRRLLWWLGLNLFGSIRAENFGTFSLTSLGAQGAGVIQVVPLLTSLIHYGMFDDAGRLDMRMSFDHRVLDGATAATALASLEVVLNQEILPELIQMSRSRVLPADGFYKTGSVADAGNEPLRIEEPAA